MALLLCGRAPVPILTLEDALLNSRAHNRQLEIARLEARKHDSRVESMRSNHLPKLQVGLLETRLLNAVNLSFPTGAFGTFPPIGPVPPADTAVRIAPRWATLFAASASEPLTQHYKISLGVTAELLDRDLAIEQTKENEQKTLSDVRALYYQLATLYFAKEAAEAQVQTLKEVDALTDRYLAQETVLQSDSLEIKARLARAEFQLLHAKNALTTLSERLNVLLGRDRKTSFRPQALPSPSAALPIPSQEDAEAQALANRAELKEARLKQSLAGVDIRSAYAAYIPDVSLIAAYIGLFNIDVLPTNIGSISLFLNWEPWDWGRRGFAVAEKKKTALQAAKALEEAEDQIQVEVGHCHRRVREADLQVKAAQASVQAASATLRVARNKYKEAAVVLKDLLQAEAQLSSTQKDLSDALSAYWSARADLTKAVGNE